MVFAVLCLLLMLEIFTPEIAKADVYDNAYTFYQENGSEMAFRAGANNQGEIYYATKAKKDEHTGIKYTTIGWQVRVFNSSGSLVETLYYQLGGKNMSSIDVQTVSGYEYCLYRVTLSNLKSRLSEAGLNALSNPDCNIIFDACTTTKLKGVVQGGMTDRGPSWGDVYTTYNGIVNAQDWSKTTRETLKSYYNKSVEGLFYDVSVETGTGIARASGAGRYCFGTEVTIGAQAQEGYHFAGWTGDVSSQKDSHKFVLYDKNVTCTATAEENNYTIQFDAAGGEGRIPTQTLPYTGEFVTPTEGFLLEGSALAGWKIETKKGYDSYLKGQQISVRELAKNLGLQNVDGAVITLYATWDHGPIITTEEIFVGLADAQAGKITEEWLSKRAEALDQEDGEIPYGKNDKTSFLLEDYNASDFTVFREEGSMTKTFLAMDSAGNMTEKKILVHIVDNRIYPANHMLGRVRFISKRYFWSADGGLLEEILGGLDENSIWRMNEEYRKLLEELFQ